MISRNYRVAVTSIATGQTIPVTEWRGYQRAHEDLALIAEAAQAAGVGIPAVIEIVSTRRHTPRPDVEKTSNVGALVLLACNDPGTVNLVYAKAYAGDHDVFQEFAAHVLGGAYVSVTRAQRDAAREALRYAAEQGIIQL